MDRPDLTIKFGESNTAVLGKFPIQTPLMIAPLVFYSHGSGLIQCQGTAFCVSVLPNGQSVYVTARHVIDELADLVNSESFLLLPSIEPVSNSLQLVGMRIDATSELVPNSDLALVRVDFRMNREPFPILPPCAPLALGEPLVGSNTVALGYSRQLVSGTFTYDAELRASQGLIEEVHPTKRDASLSTFPSARISTLYEPGMSGGPVFTERGGVVGVVSTGLSSSEAEPYGYAALIGGLAVLSIELETPDGNSRMFTVPELSDLGMVAHMDNSELSFDQNEQGLTLKWRPDQ